MDSDVFRMFKSSLPVAKGLINISTQTLIMENPCIMKRIEFTIKILWHILCLCTSWISFPLNIYFHFPLNPEAFASGNFEIKCYWIDRFTNKILDCWKSRALASRFTTIVFPYNFYIITNDSFPVYQLISHLFMTPCSYVCVSFIFNFPLQ